HTRRINLSQTLQRVVHILLFEMQLRSVIHMLPFATSTRSKMRTKRIYPMLRSRFQRHQSSLGKALLLSKQLHIGDVARNSMLYKHDELVLLCYSFPLLGYINNIYVCYKSLVLWNSSTHNGCKNTFFSRQ